MGLSRKGSRVMGSRVVGMEEGWLTQASCFCLSSFLPIVGGREEARKGGEGREEES